MKIKLLFIPSYQTDVNDNRLINWKFLPPLGLAINTAFLKKYDFKSNQDDLNAHFWQDFNTKKTLDFQPFTIKKEIEKFIKNKSNDILEEQGEKILKFTKTKGFDVFGFSIYEGNNPSVTGLTLVLAKILKEKYGSKIIIGGQIPDIVEESILKTGIVDYAMRYKTVSQPNLVDFCTKFEEGKEFDASGLKYIKKNKIIQNNFFAKEIEFVRPEFKGLPFNIYRRKVKYYEDSNISKDMLVLPYFFVVGCPKKCNFCSNSTSSLWGINNPKEVANDLEYLTKKFKTKYFFFLNSSINPTYKYGTQITKAIQTKNISIAWSDCAIFQNMDQKLLDELKKAGAKRLIFGLENASPRIQKRINKNINIPKAEQILKYAHEIGIRTEIELIPGLPFETNDDQEKTLKFIKKNKKFIDETNIFKFWLEGRFLRYPEKFGIIIESQEDKEISLDGLRRPFHEINGLSWKEKIKQTEKFYNELKDSYINTPGIKTKGITIDDAIFLDWID